MVRTGQVTSSTGTTTMTATQFKEKICENVNIIVDCDSKVTVYVNSSTSFAALDTLVPSPSPSARSTAIPMPSSSRPAAARPRPP